MTMTYEYRFEEIERRALTAQTEDAIRELGEWYQDFGSMFWNGEHYTGKFNGREYQIAPVYEETDEDIFEIVGWELR